VISLINLIVVSGGGGPRCRAPPAPMIATLLTDLIEFVDSKTQRPARI